MENEQPEIDEERKKKIESVALCFADIVNQFVNLGDFSKGEIACMGFPALAKIAYDEVGYENFCFMLDSVKRLADFEEATKLPIEPKQH